MKKIKEGLKRLGKQYTLGLSKDGYEVWWSLYPGGMCGRIVGYQKTALGAIRKACEVEGV